MTFRPAVAWLDGRLVPWADAVVPIEDRGLMFAESLYEVLPLTSHRARLVDEHAERLAASARALGLEAGAPDARALGSIADALIDREGLEEGLVYVQLTGGHAPRAHVLDAPVSPTLFAYLQPHRFPRAEDTRRGARVFTLEDPRWARCDLKTTMLVPAVLARREALRRGCDEALWTGPDGELREGASSNVAVVRSGRIHSPALGVHVLPGVTRRVVGEISRSAGYDWVEEILPAADLYDVDEMFLTSTSRLVLPVLWVDGRPIGEGRPGPVALDLAGRMRALFELSPGRA